MSETDDAPDAYELVRTAILDGTLPPGKVMAQPELSEMLGIGRTPLREAVRRLQSERLLEATPRRRIRISPLSPDDLAELYTLRIVLESLAVRFTVPLLTDADLADAREALDRHVEACARQDLTEAREPHHRFHRALYARCGERMLTQVESLWDQAERYRRNYVSGGTDEMALLQLAVADHEELYQAAARRDGVLCSELVARHLTRTALTVFARLEDSTGPERIRVALDLVRFGSQTP